MHASWEQRFETWWRHTPITPMNLSSRRIAGTIADVYTSVRDGDTCLAMKTVSSDSKKIMHDNIMLFSEYSLHAYVLSLYDKETRTPRLVNLHWIKKIRLRGHTVVAFAMDRLYETWYNRTKTTFLPMEWKRQALVELKHWNHRWGVFHRDPHLNNLGVLPDGRWCFFDMSMACLSNGTACYNKNAFYPPDEYPSFNMDVAILNASWCQYQNNDSWTTLKRSWHVSPPESWKRRTPVLVGDCIFGRQAKYISNAGTHFLTVEFKIKRSLCETIADGMCTMRGIPVPFKVHRYYADHISIRCSVNKQEVKPDVNHPHIAYYMYDI